MSPRISIKIFAITFCCSAEQCVSNDKINGKGVEAKAYFEIAIMTSRRRILLVLIIKVIKHWLECQRLQGPSVIDNRLVIWTIPTVYYR